MAKKNTRSTKLQESAVPAEQQKPEIASTRIGGTIVDGKRVVEKPPTPKEK